MHHVRSLTYIPASGLSLISSFFVFLLKRSLISSLYNSKKLARTKNCVVLEVESIF